MPYGHEQSLACEPQREQDAELARNGGSDTDVWGFATEDGRSLRGAIDYMLPFVAGWTPWPYPQTETPNWSTMREVLRRAANAYGNMTYEAVYCNMTGGAKDHSVFNLLVPPRFPDVTC